MIGGLLLCLGVGVLVGMLLVGVCLDWFGCKLILIILVISFVLLFIFILLMMIVLVLVFVLFLFGMSIGFIDCVMNL